jgi:CheY-like chemotaxis protein
MKAQKFTLLIIDDDANDRFFLERAFKKLAAAYHIHPMVSGNQALDYIKGKGIYADRKKYQFPSYIITDLKMPDGDGFAVLEFLKHNPALSVIPVVMLSSSNDQDDIRQSYLLGASSYFVKPHSPEELTSLIQSIHHYWSQCQVPQVDAEGFALTTSSAGKAGERFHKPKKPA